MSFFLWVLLVICIVIVVVLLVISGIFNWGTDNCKGPGLTKSDRPNVTDRSKWMSQFPDKNVFQMFLPGTHDSSAYTVSYPRELSKNHTTLLGTVVKQFVITQEYNIFEQLMYGIRVFDFRVNTLIPGTVWLSHTAFTIPLEQAFQHISDFIYKNPSEVIIILIKADWETNKISKLDWNPVASLIQKYFSNKTIPEANRRDTIGQLTQLGKNIIFVNVDNASVGSNESGVLWRSELVQNKWYNTSDLDTLMNKLSVDALNHENRSGDFLFGSGPIMTPDLDKDILPGINPFNFSCKWTSTKNMASKANYRFLQFLKHNPITGLHFVMLDFFHDSIIDEILKLNDSSTIPGTTNL